MLADAPSAAERDREDEPEPAERRKDRVERDPIRRPVGHEDLPDEGAPGDGPPPARVARLGTVVAHEEVVALGNVPDAGLVVATARLDVRLVELLAVDVDEPVRLANGLPREADQALDERAACVARRLGPRLRRGE